MSLYGNQLTFTICTSKKFQDLVPKIATKLEGMGHIVFVPFFTGNADLVTKFSAHFKKIHASDAIYVIDPDGYVGESVSAEIAFAMLESKRIVRLSYDDVMQEYLGLKEKKDV